MARELGYRTMVLSSCIEGETREVARVHAAILKEHTGCILSGGGDYGDDSRRGIRGPQPGVRPGGAIDIAGLPKTVVLSAGTDGTDGPTDAAGAIADGGTVRAARYRRMHGSISTRNDSYHFFEAAGGLLKTGRRGRTSWIYAFCGAPSRRFTSSPNGVG